MVSISRTVQGGIGTLMLLVGVPVFAATPLCPAPGATPTTFSEVLCMFIGFINSLLPLIVAMTLVIFFWGLAKFIQASGDEKAVIEGKKLMFWGIIALFVMVSFVGILNFFYGDFFGGTIGIPQLPV